MLRSAYLAHVAGNALGRSEIVPTGVVVQKGVIESSRKTREFEIEELAGSIGAFSQPTPRFFATKAHLYSNSRKMDGEPCLFSNYPENNWVIPLTWMPDI